MSKKVEFTNGELNKIIDLYINQNKSLTDIADCFKHKITGYGIIKRLFKENNIKLREYTKNRKNALNLDINYFEVINTEEKAYWLGYLAADGHITKTNNKVTLISKDLDIIEKFKKSIKSEHKISKSTFFDKRYNKSYTRYVIKITSKNFTEYLLQHGITSNKTNKLEFPNLPEELYRHFFRGLFDGDGSISSMKKNSRSMQANLISTKEILTYLEYYLIDKLNINVGKQYKVTENKENVYKLYFYKDTSRFLDWLYQNSTIYLNRKYSTYIEYKKFEDKFGLPSNKRKILQLDLKNIPIKKWDSIKEAKKSLGVTSISNALSGKLKTSGGYKWRYINHNEIINFN